MSVGGELLIVGAPFEPMEISVMQLLLTRRAIQGWPSGTAMDSQETLEFSSFAGARPRIETYPLAKVKDAYERACGVPRRIDGGLRTLLRGLAAGGWHTAAALLHEALRD